MKCKIVTHFLYKDYAHRCEIKTNELIKAYEITKGFVIGSKTCRLSIWEKSCRKKLPNFVQGFFVSDLEKNGILYDVQNFQNWILNIKKELEE